MPEPHTTEPCPECHGEPGNDVLGQFNCDYCVGAGFIMVIDFPEED